MQSGERERAGSGKQKDQQQLRVNVTEEHKTKHERQCGQCWRRPQRWPAWEAGGRETAMVSVWK
jgi:hypothetical protein